MSKLGRLVVSTEGVGMRVTRIGQQVVQRVEVCATIAA